MLPVTGQKIFSLNGQIWRVAVVTAAAAVSTASYAQAALYYWSDSDGGLSRPVPPVQQRRQGPRHHQAKNKKIQAPEKESSKPQGPLIISISIEKQRLRIYDARGFFAETPISTGMKGHPTPMGVFSIIQKHKFHHSNIYSGAPMPYMQRITWSGVAMHAGVLPGYPASHGCIRMPMAFAIKMWNWTKMGARVVVTPGELTPSSFSHPLLVAQKVVPIADQPETDTPPAPKSDKASSAEPEARPATTLANLELRSTVGHADGVTSVISGPSTPAPLRETRTADASGNRSVTNAAITMSDATTGAGKTPAAAEPTVSAKPADAPKAEEKSEETAKTQDGPAAAERHETASSDDKTVAVKPPELATTETKSAETKSDDMKPGEAKSSETKSSEIKSSEINSPEADKTEKQADEATIAVPTGDAAKTETSATEAPKADVAKVDGVKTGAVASDAPKASEKADDQVKPAADSAAALAVKDQGRPAGIEKAAVKTPDPAIAAALKRTGQIAMFVSRKDSKLYVRQNFSPLFNVPVTIAPSDRPLGTHVFTAEVDKNDANVLHWSVVTLPSPRHAERRDEGERVSRKRKMTGAVEMKPSPPPDSPAEALDRLNIPVDVMARIAEAITTGGSIIVSDQGIAAGETGEGTDFIVSLR